MPDAWDDDWIQKTGSKPSTPDTTDPPASGTKVSKAERRAKQAEFNRQLWADAETEQGENFFLKTQGVVPLKSEFKPAVTVLSRKPILARGSGVANGIGQLSIDDDDDEDAPKVELTPEERKQKAQKEREEKQKAYEERRRELFGTDGSGNSASGRRGGSPRNQSRANRTGESRPASSASSARQLFDPNESAKPESMRPVKPQTPVENSPIRQPRAPDGSGRGGFGFTNRGGHAS